MAPRLLAALAAAASLLQSLAPAAPVPKEKPAEAYFPTKVGARWVYQFFSDGKLIGEREESVRRVEDRDGGTVVTVSEVAPDGSLSHHASYRVAPDGVFLTDLGRGLGAVTPPLCVLKLPHTDGGRWAAEPSAQGVYHLTRFSFTAHGPEEVTTRAGTFRVIRVGEEKTQGRGPTRTYTNWYAPGVGLVRSTYENRVGNRFPEKGETVLKAFTPGKD